MAYDVDDMDNLTILSQAVNNTGQFILQEINISTIFQFMKCDTKKVILFNSHLFHFALDLLYIWF